MDKKPMNFFVFYEAMGRISLKDKKGAVFGPGDSEDCPDSFGTAVDILEESLKGHGSEIVAESFRIDGVVEPAFEDAEAWGLKVAKAL